MPAAVRVQNFFVVYTTIYVSYIPLHMSPDIKDTCPPPIGGCVDVTLFCVIELY